MNCPCDKTVTQMETVLPPWAKYGAVAGLMALALLKKMSWNNALSAAGIAFLVLESASSKGGRV